jgi:hypothetical protein
MSGHGLRGPLPARYTVFHTLARRTDDRWRLVLDYEERDGADVIWLSLDPGCTTVVDVEVLDPTGLDISIAQDEQSPRPPSPGAA